MKTQLFVLTILIFSVTFTSMMVTTETTKATATVNQIEGVYVFIQSKPVTPTDYMGTVKKSVSWTGKPDEMLNSMIKKAKKEYPSCEAIIFVDNDMDKVDVIKFKQ